MSSLSPYHVSEIVIGARRDRHCYHFTDGKQAGKVKYNGLGAWVDLHSDRPGSKASVPVSDATLPPTHSPPVGIRAI